jgi:hypothetical protein
MVVALNAYSDVLRDWCDQGDGICAFGAEPYSETIHLSYYDLYSSDAGAWVKSVAGLTDDSTFTTAIPTQLSGTAQDYATIGTATPTGTVIVDTTWTKSIAVTAKPTSGASSTSTPKSTTSNSGSGSTSLALTTATVTPGTNTKATSTATTAASSSTSSAGAGARNVKAPLLGVLFSAAIALTSYI